MNPLGFSTKTIITKLHSKSLHKPWKNLKSKWVSPTNSKLSTAFLVPKASFHSLTTVTYHTNDATILKKIKSKCHQFLKLLWLNLPKTFNLTLKTWIQRNWIIFWVIGEAQKSWKVVLWSTLKKFHMDKQEKVSHVQKKLKWTQTESMASLRTTR